MVPLTRKGGGGFAPPTNVINPHARATEASSVDHAKCQRRRTVRKFLCEGLGEGLDLFCLVFRAAAATSGGDDDDISARIARRRKEREERMAKL